MPVVSLSILTALFWIPLASFLTADWMVRDDVRAKLQSSIKRLLVKYKYPPDKQPGAIRLVTEQMEAMAPRYTT